MTNHSSPDAPLRILHRRLTVALASTAERARLAQVLAGDLAPGGSPLIRSEDLWMAADGFAKLRLADRLQHRSSLDLVAARTGHDHETASSQLQSLASWRQNLLDGATWAIETDEGPRGEREAVEVARGVLDERRHDHRAALQNLERVLEQRRAAAQAIEEADGELGDVVGLGMDESGLRRELEAAGRAVQDAEGAHRDAVARLEERRAEQAGIQLGRVDLGAISSLAAPAAVDTVTEAVAKALVALRTVSSGFDDVDPQAVALADAWRDLTSDIAQLPPIQEPPSEEEVGAAQDRLAAVDAELAALDDAAQASTLTATERAAIDAAHEALLEAEERTGRRVGAAAARKRVDETRAAERALLDRHGFPAYIDVVITGGRSGAIDPRRAGLERERFDAVSAVDALKRALEGTPERQHLESERRRLHAHAMDVLGVDPADRTLELLKAHRQVGKTLQMDLIDALADAGVRPVGISLEAAAVSYLETHGIALLDHPDEDGWIGWPLVGHEAATADLVAKAEHATGAAEASPVDVLIEAIGRDIDAAQSEVDRLAEELHLAQRSVVALEGELTLRAGADEARAQRTEAAEQLRVQIEAVSASLERAEQSARTEIAQSERRLVAAEGEFDEAVNAVSEVARQARQLAEELPIDLRPEGDPLDGLVVLAGRLQAHAEVLGPEIARAEDAVATVSAQLEEALTAARVAAAGADGPQSEDLIAGLEKIFATEPVNTLIVLDEPFVGVDPAVRVELLDTLLHVVGDRQVVLLSEDPDVLGWAIELPAEVASAMPADALLTRFHRANEPVPAPVAPVPDKGKGKGKGKDRARASVDITEAATEPKLALVPDPTPPEHPAPTIDAPPTRRWAGQR